MKFRRLGKSGLKVSELSFGSWVTFGNQIDLSVARTCMRRAYDSGINFFDNAEAYAQGKSEEVMGEILQQEGWARDTYIVSSKVFWGGKKPNQFGLCRKHVMEACHAALHRLRVDYLDLYFCHRPDPETPIEETVRAMNTLIEQGKVLYWGTSEWSARELEEAKEISAALGLIGPTMEQPQYNLLHRDRVEREYAPLYASVGGLGTTIWSPLASGLLTGKYNDGIPEGSRMANPQMSWLKDLVLGDPDEWQRKLVKFKALAAIAAEIEVTLAELAIGWCLSNPNVSTVILGASRVEQLEHNLKALKVPELLSSEILSRIDTAVADPA